MTTIYILHCQNAGIDSVEEYYFSSIDNIVQFLNQHEQRKSNYPQTVVAIQLDTNIRQPVYINGYENPCNTFSINKLGEMKPLNVYNKK